MEMKKKERQKKMVLGRSIQRSPFCQEKALTLLGEIDTCIIAKDRKRYHYLNS